MKKLLILSGVAGIVALVAACEEHEVIPPPVPIVDLKCACDAVIDDSTVQYTDSCRYFSNKTINTGSLSTAEYSTTIQRNNLVHGVKLTISTLEWTDDGSNTPSLEQWQAFFDNNMTPGYATGSITNGVLVEWTDPNNKVWVSDTGGVCFSNFSFVSMIQDSDTTGDYMLFEASFNCKLKNSDYSPDSIKCLENGYVKSAFKLE
ncbi:MAG: hypothetical protein IPM74_18245 [Crocinitomicaceae bacterium]|nr:hypothetical protein [Crocinitomicaceae bacterium]MBK8927784.1 hypothetical protein [Crocinitomicaceae bacterium]